MVLPVLVLFTVMIIIPAIDGFRISLTDWDGVFSVPNYIGFRNYKKFFSDPGFYSSLWITIKMAVLTVALQNILGLFTALMLQRDTKLNVGLRALFFIPTLLTMIVVGLIFSYVFSPIYGPINQIGETVGWRGLAKLDWFGNKTAAFWVVIIASVWTGFGTSMIIYIAGLKNIPRDFYESAALDGVNAWTKFWHITLPLLAPSITVNMLMSVINGLKIFDIPFAMTQGGPAGATTTIAVMLYKDAFFGRSAGYAAAESLVLMIIVFVISGIQTNYLRSREVSY